MGVSGFINLETSVILLGFRGVVPASQKLRNLQATLISWITGYTILLTSCALGFPRVFAKDFSPESLIKAIHLYKVENL